VLDRVFRLGMRHGWRRGVMRGNPVWVVVGAVALVLHLAGKALRRDEEVVISEKLLPGESVTVTHQAAP
jgi:hypothetical protein